MRGFPEQVDRQLRASGRYGAPGSKGKVPAAGCPYRSGGDSGETGVVYRRRFLASAFSVGRGEGFVASGGKITGWEGLTNRLARFGCVICNARCKNYGL